MSDERAFGTIAARELGRLEAAVSDLDGVEADLGGDVLTIELPGGRVCVVNSHSAARQIWVAANARAWHFSPEEDGRWVDTREGRELWAVVSEVLSTGLGREVRLR